ncbi:MAG TPA: hypothetical protein VFA43_19820 [Gemmatimonadaceae bacterium]|nr:hypothetical protein [Gemmatimonadaceae bacterium]
MPKFALFVCRALLASHLSAQQCDATQGAVDVVETYEFAPFTVNGCAAKLYTITAVRFGR